MGISIHSIAVMLRKYIQGTGRGLLFGVGFVSEPELWHDAATGSTAHTEKANAITEQNMKWRLMCIGDARDAWAVETVGRER
jgi:hypothetical protein